MFAGNQHLTNISWCPTGCEHHTIFQRLRQAKVTDHDLGVLIPVVIQQVLRLLGDTDTKNLKHETKVKSDDSCVSVSPWGLYGRCCSCAGSLQPPAPVWWLCWPPSQWKPPCLKSDQTAPHPTPCAHMNPQVISDPRFLEGFCSPSGSKMDSK